VRKSEMTTRWWKDGRDGEMGVRTLSLSPLMHWSLRSSSSCSHRTQKRPATSDGLVAFSGLWEGSSMDGYLG
jgi:hypothetical protein